MGYVQEEIPSSSTDSSFTEQCDNVCLVFETAEEEKKNVFYGFTKMETLICFVWRFVTLLVITRCLRALWEGQVLPIRLAPGESGKFVSRTFSSTLCIPPTLCSLCNANCNDPSVPWD